MTHQLSVATFLAILILAAAAHTLQSVPEEYKLVSSTSNVGMAEAVPSVAQYNPWDYWEYGFLCHDDGSQRCNGRVPPTYFLDIPCGSWHSHSLRNLMDLDPPPVYVTRVFVGAEGWDFDGYWDQVSLKADGAELVEDGDFAEGFTHWEKSSGGGGNHYLTIEPAAGRQHVFHYKRTNAGCDGGSVRAWQDINACVWGTDSLVFSGEVYLIDHSLHNPGWWCCVHGCAPEHGEYAGEVLVFYLTSFEPVITCPPDVRMEADEDCQVTYAGPCATATDLCDPDPTITSVPPFPPIFSGEGKCTITWIATNFLGKADTCFQTITVVDATPPIVAGVPPDDSVECNAVPEPATPTVTDNCDPSPEVSFGQVVTNEICEHAYTITRTWIATDRSGNETITVQNIRVADTTPPEITCPGDTVISADEDCEAVYSGPPATATDNCDELPAVACDPELPVTLHGLGTHSIAYTAEDECWNTSTCTQTVTVTDVTPPEITCPSDTTMEANENCQVKYEGPAAQAVDNCDPDPTILSDPPLPAVFTGVGAHSMTWIAADSSGNADTCFQAVTVIDLIPPMIVCPPDTVLEADENCQMVYTGPPATATDNCDSDPMISSNPPLPASFTGLGDYEIKYTATDASGNTSSCIQVVKAIDVTPPEIICPSDTTMIADESCEVLYGGPPASAVDNCDSSPVITSEPMLPATFAGVGNHQIVYTATDASGNYSTCTQIITVIDVTPPRIECPPDADLEPEGFDCVVTYSGPPATATDNCDPAPAITGEPPLPATFGTIGEHTIVFTATDFSGNASLCTMTVTVLPTSFCLKHETIGLLEALKPTGSKHLDKEIDKVALHIEKSLDAAIWTDVKRLDCSHGQKVFNEEKTALVHLMKEMNKKKFPPDLVDDFMVLVNMLLDADEILARTQLDDAIADGGETEKIEKAEREMMEAEKKRDEGDYVHTIDHYRKAWDDACKALAKESRCGAQVALDGARSSSFRLRQNSPNPFNAKTRISFTLPVAGHATVSVFDARGRLVTTLVNGHIEAGNHTAVWERGDAASGVYFCVLTSEGRTSARKMVAVR
jgi:hypothetical protein